MGNDTQSGRHTIFVAFENEFVHHMRSYVTRCRMQLKNRSNQFGVSDSMPAYDDQYERADKICIRNVINCLPRSTKTLKKIIILCFCRSGFDRSQSDCRNARKSWCLAFGKLYDNDDRPTWKRIEWKWFIFDCSNVHQSSSSSLLNCISRWVRFDTRECTERNLKVVMNERNNCIFSPPFHALIYFHFLRVCFVSLLSLPSLFLLFLSWWSTHTHKPNI